jgi:hypothetical protein
MSSKPGVFALSKQATDFVFSNVPLFFNHIKVVFPLLIFCAVLKQAGLLAEAKWVGYAVAAVTLFLYGCFALAWHRSSLIGPDNAHEENPLTLKGDDWNFIALFMGISGTFGLSMDGLGYLATVVLPKYGDGIAMLGGIVVLGVMGFVMLMFIRASFLFPARSVGVKLTWKDARKASKGLIWPLIGTNIIFGLLFVVAFSVYAFVASFIAQIAAGGASLGRIEAIGTGLVLSIPILLAAFFLVALCITALSRAYQWGVQNNH